MDAHSSPSSDQTPPHLDPLADAQAELANLKAANTDLADQFLRAKAEVEKLANVNKGHMATDSDGDMVFLTRLKWDIDRVERDYPAVKLTATKEMMV